MVVFFVEVRDGGEVVTRKVLGDLYMRKHLQDSWKRMIGDSVLSQDGEEGLGIGDGCGKVKSGRSRGL